MPSAQFHPLRCAKFSCSSYQSKRELRAFSTRFERPIQVIRLTAPLSSDEQGRTATLAHSASESSRHPGSTIALGHSPHAATSTHKKHFYLLDSLHGN